MTDVPDEFVPSLLVCKKGKNEQKFSSGWPGSDLDVVFVLTSDFNHPCESSKVMTAVGYYSVLRGGPKVQLCFICGPSQHISAALTQEFSLSVQWGRHYKLAVRGTSHHLSLQHLQFEMTVRWYLLWLSHLTANYRATNMTWIEDQYTLCRRAGHLVFSQMFPKPRPLPAARCRQVFFVSTNSFLYIPHITTLVH